LTEPAPDDAILIAPAAASTAETEEPPMMPMAKRKMENLAASLFASFKPVKHERSRDDVDEIIDQAAPAMDEATEMLIAHIRAAAEDATSIEDLQRKVLAMMPGLPEGQLAAAMGQALVLANLTGRDLAEAAV
jgi:phage gp29-like protein